LNFQALDSLRDGSMEDVVALIDVLEGARRTGDATKRVSLQHDGALSVRRLISMTLASCLTVGGWGLCVAYAVGLLQTGLMRGIAFVWFGFVGGLGLLWLWEDLTKWQNGR
jgi:hypothetical protein